jgi:hypothetical protein
MFVGSSWDLLLDGVIIANSNGNYESDDVMYILFSRCGIRCLALSETRHPCCHGSKHIVHGRFGFWVAVNQAFYMRLHFNSFEVGFAAFGFIVEILYQTQSFCYMHLVPLPLQRSLNSAVAVAFFSGLQLL